jgi:hypothetical protein
VNTWRPFIGDNHAIIHLKKEGGKGERVAKRKEGKKEGRKERKRQLTLFSKLKT